LIILAAVRKNYDMEPDKNREAEKNKKTGEGNFADKLMDKAEDFMDDTTQKIITSEPYKKAGNTMEKATIDLFRKAGRWWGKL
jgi:hypothetical protein